MIASNLIYTIKPLVLVSIGTLLGNYHYFYFLVKLKGHQDKNIQIIEIKGHQIDLLMASTIFD